MNHNDIADNTLYDRREGAYIVLLRDVVTIYAATFATEDEAKEHATAWSDDYLAIIHWTRVNGVDTMRSMDFDATEVARERAAEAAASFAGSSGRHRTSPSSNPGRTFTRVP